MIADFASEARPPTMATFRSLVAALAIVPLWAQPSTSQTPPPKNESELVAAGYKRLTAAQLRQKFVGNTSYVLQVAPVPGVAAGVVFILYYKSDKERVVKPASGGGPKYTVVWWLEGDLLCAEEKPPAPVGHRCYAFYEVKRPFGTCAASPMVFAPPLPAPYQAIPRTFEPVERSVRIRAHLWLRLQ